MVCDRDATIMRQGYASLAASLPISLRSIPIAVIIVPLGFQGFPYAACLGCCWRAMALSELSRDSAGLCRDSGGTLLMLNGSADGDVPLKRDYWIACLTWCRRDRFDLAVWMSRKFAGVRVVCHEISRV
jgi:hypothetical protein